MTVVSDKPTAESIFLAALELPPDRRAVYLIEACGGDRELSARVERLLAAQSQVESFLETPAPELGAVDGFALEQPGTIIGPYTLVEQIGEGGFGVVFLAEQATPIRRRVALKIIKPGMDTRQVVARFEAERQALALMDHPGIAKVFDAGVTEQGRSYFVMELVQGVPINEYCDQCNLPTRERLSLFIAVCQAVQHAHQKGIIHRDLKPTNVLVTLQDGRPMPKIIDFGIAKAIDERLTEHTLTTGYAQMVGTPMYMSPEQAELSLLGVDTRTDIYSLGVLFYELLAGTTPFDRDRLHAASYDELRRIIREEEPPRPSTRLTTLAVGEATTIAEHRRSDVRKLGQSIRGELDWIAMKCLEKDRNRRYDSTGSLAGDVERYLQDEPVQACPPSTSYRFYKFAKRNRTLLAAGVAIAAALFMGLGISTLMYLRERAAVAAARNDEARATTESARAKAVSNLFLEIVFSRSKGWRIKGSEYTAREMFDDFAANLGNQLADQPEVEAQLRHAIGCSYLMLGAPDRAEPFLKRATDLRRTRGGEQLESLPDCIAVYGKSLMLQGKYDEAENQLREALEIYHQQGVRGTMPISVYGDLQQALASSGRHEEAERAIDEAWTEMQSSDELPPEFIESHHSDVAGACAYFAYYFATIGRQKEAAEFLRRATRAQQRLRSPVESLLTLQLLALARLRLGDEPGYQEACRALVDPAVRITKNNFVQADEFNLGRIWTCCMGPNAFADPSVLVRQAEQFAASNSLHAPYIDENLLGAAHYRAGEFEQAATHFEKSIADYPNDPPPSHGTVLWPQLYLAMTTWQQGAHDDARRLLNEIQPAIEESLKTPTVLRQYRQITELLRREAEALINPNEADKALDNADRDNNEAQRASAH